jgi:hypothetical protein
MFLALSAGLCGCYTYAVAARGPGPDFDQLPIDRMNPQTSFQWRYFWGLSDEPVWSPIICNNGEHDAAGHCLKGSSDPCHGKGIGFFEVQVPWYGELLTLVTLGVVSTVHTTYYCSTYTPAGDGPSSGPQ